LKHVINFQKFLKTVNFKTELDSNKIKRNWQAEFSIRSDNLYDLINRKRIPFEE
jgi:hypothetical protein